MKWFRVQSFYDSWRPVYKVSRFFCLTTVTNNFVDRTPVRTSTDHTLLIVGFIMCGLLAHNSIETYMEGKFSLTDSKLISVGLLSYFMLIELTVMSAFVLNYTNGFQIAKFFDIIHKADQQIAMHFDHTWNYQRQHFRTVAYLVFSYAQQLVFIQALSLQTPDISTFSTFQLLRIMVAFWWVMGCFQALASTAIMYLVTISERFAVLNKYMKEHLDIYLAEPDKVDDPRRKIRQFAMMHAMLSDMIRLFNDCFAKQITLALGCAFLFLLFAIFGLIHAYAAVNADYVTYQVATANMLFSGFFYFLIFQLVVCTNRLNYECKRCRVIIQKAVSYGRYERRIFRECKLFSMQLMHHTQTVSSGMFDFDWTLCYLMVGSLTTHLVILLQFDFVNFKTHAEALKQG